MSKGGETTTTQEIDPVLRQYAIEGMRKADDASEIPFQANRGNQIAAFTPDQEASFSNMRNAAQAFGLEAGNKSMYPEAREENGIMGYGFGDQYDSNVAQSTTQAVRDAIAANFIDPETGAPALNSNPVDETLTVGNTTGGGK